ncbi:PAS domain-containing protein, partial [Actinomadura montaniterrae]
MVPDARDTARTDTALADAALFGALVTEVPFGVAFLDSRLRLRRANAALRALLRGGGAGGRNGVNPVGRRLTEVLDGEFAAVLEPALRGVLDDGRAVTGLEVRGPAPADPGSARGGSASGGSASGAPDAAVP